jgi:hypothetical protein
MRRNDISNERLLGLVAATLAAIAAWFVVQPWLPQPWRTPGSPPLYLAGVAGTVLLLVPAAFSIAKRGGVRRDPLAWFNAHIVCACAGALLVAIHSGGYLRRPPALLLAALAALAVLGTWARVRGARLMAATFASKAPGFAPPDAAGRERLRALIAEKRRLLRALDPAAREATFSVALAHWVRSPRLAAVYRRLEREEARLLGGRRRAPPQQAWWRPLHLALAWIFVAGVAIHVLTVTFFAGYVADYGPVTWWHVTAW